MNLFNQVANNQLDYDWVALIMEAKKEGLSIEEIRAFFRTINHSLPNPEEFTENELGKRETI